MQKTVSINLNTDNRLIKVVFYYIYDKFVY